MRRAERDLFETLIRENWFKLVAFVHAAVHDPARADEIVQESVIAAWERLETYDQARPFGAWLRGIANNKIREQLRAISADRRIARLTESALDEIAVQFDRLFPGRGDDEGPWIAALQECMKGLSPDQHEVLRGVYWENQRCDAMASRLGESAAAIRQRLFRIRSQLKDCITGKLALA